MLRGTGDHVELLHRPARREPAQKAEPDGQEGNTAMLIDVDQGQYALSISCIPPLRFV
jgi:hypothetical protein